MIGVIIIKSLPLELLLLSYNIELSHNQKITF